MSLILVIEQDGSYAERIQGALAAEGWTVRVVGDRAAAIAASRPGTTSMFQPSAASAPRIRSVYAASCSMTRIRDIGLTPRWKWSPFVASEASAVNANA